MRGIPGQELREKIKYLNFVIIDSRPHSLGCLLSLDPFPEYFALFPLGRGRVGGGQILGIPHESESRPERNVFGIPPLLDGELNWA